MSNASLDVIKVWLFNNNHNGCFVKKYYRNIQSYIIILSLKSEHINDAAKIQGQIYENLIHVILHVPLLSCMSMIFHDTQHRASPDQTPPDDTATPVASATFSHLYTQRLHLSGS